MRVEVYFNLTRKLWSVRALEGPDKGRVFAHLPEVTVKNAKFVVREGGRQRVLKEKQKNVHAFVRGTFCDERAGDLSIPVTYNPYKYDSFVRRSDEEPIYEAPVVFMNSNRKVTCEE
jgi:hypothetical protein